MDKLTTIKELKTKVEDFCEARDWSQYHNPKDLAIGISTEANELLSIFRFKDNNEMAEMFEKNNKREEIEDEVADILFFVLRFAQMNNIDLSEALNNKIEKNNTKYSIEKFKGSNKKYTEE